MAKYTIELRRICELYGRDTVENWFKDYELSEFLLPSQIEVLETSNIWNKDRLASRIVDFYYMREIGLETPYLFKHYAKVFMQNIMETKLPIIYTMALEYDPLINVNYTETFERTANEKGNIKNSGTSNFDSNSNGSSLDIMSDTPQGQIDKAEILSGKYATSTSANENINKIIDKTNTNSNTDSNNNTTEQYRKHFEGNSGVSATYQKMIEQFRENIVSINKEIIEELNPLFMGLY